MNREKQEVMVKTLKRMAATFKKKESKGPKKSKPLKKSQLPLVTGEEVGVQDIRVESDTVVVMDQNGGAVDVETMQNYQWQSGMQLSYKTAMFHIVVNPPLVTAISIFPKQMVLRDYPVVPTVSTEFADGVQYEWYRETDDKDFVSVGRQQVFTPTADSIGKRLKVYCTPYRRVAAGCVALNQQSGAASEAGGGSAGGLETAFESLVITACTEPESTPDNYIYGRTMTCYLSGTVRDAARVPKILEVRSGYLAVRRFSDDRDNNKDFRIPVTVPEADASATSSSSSSAYNPYSRYEIYAPFSACNNIAGPSKDVSSHNYGSSNSVREADELRIVSYNILAEPFATSDYAVKHMFGYCPLEYLETDYRMQLILRELLAYDADVLCLQECDAKVFKLYLQPALMLRGYSGSYLNKSSGVLEGCATFTRDSALVVLRRVDLPMKNVLRHAPYLQGIYALRPDLQDVLGGKLGTVVQFTVCQSVCDGRVIIFANTHLFYHPAAAFVRLAQTDLILRVATEMKEYITKNGVKEFMKSYRHPGEEPAAVEEDEGRGGDPRGLESSSGDNAKESKPVKKVSIVFMGDLNSTPETGVNELLHRYVTTLTITAA
jgi:mRNA deadenylase 3'-5' endonuclease subunit Ccr4